jgi:hypothetical protein
MLPWAEKPTPLGDGELTSQIQSNRELPFENLVSIRPHSAIFFIAGLLFIVP